MSLVRRDIVNAFRDTVKYADTLAKKNVSTYRVNPNWFEKLPAINVYPTHESAGEVHEQAPLSFKRRLQISIECVVAGKDEDTASDLLDILMEQVEQALGYKYIYDKEFRCMFEKYFPVEVDFDFAGDGKQIIAGGKITYEVHFYTEATTRRIKLDDFERLGVTYAVGGSTTTTEDLTDIPQ